MPQKVAERLLSWASDIEPGTIEQAVRTARLPFVPSHVALMPDAHVGSRRMSSPKRERLRPPWFA